MAGYRPSSFFAFLWTETRLRSMKTQVGTRLMLSYFDHRQPSRTACQYRSECIVAIIDRQIRIGVGSLCQAVLSVSVDHGAWNGLRNWRVDYF